MTSALQLALSCSSKEERTAGWPSHRLKLTGLGGEINFLPETTLLWLPTQRHLKFSTVFGATPGYSSKTTRPSSCVPAQMSMKTRICSGSVLVSSRCRTVPCLDSVTEELWLPKVTVSSNRQA